MNVHDIAEYGSFPTLGVPYWGVPMKRIIVFWGTGVPLIWATSISTPRVSTSGGWRRGEGGGLGFRGLGVWGLGK